MQLDLIDFTKRFDGVAVIEDMTLSVKTGEMLALLGPSGCGKSTTLFAICGIHRIDGGQLKFGGRDVAHLPVSNAMWAWCSRTTRFTRICRSLKTSPFR